MQNLPNILPAEVTIVCAAFVLLCIAPVVLAWSDRRRRRRLERQAAAAAVVAAPMSGAEALSAWSVAGDTGDASQVAPTPSEPLTDHSDSFRALDVPPVEHQTPAPVDARLDEAPSEIASHSPELLRIMSELPPVAEASVAPAEVAGGVAMASPHTPEPISHRFQLQDLRRVRLRDWPPTAVRDDPERLRIWHEAEALFHEQQAAINAVVLTSPMRAESCCLGAAETDGTRYRLCFFLFPVLWPVSDAQAAAHAVFEIDRGGSDIRGWVEDLQR